jgi:Kef-type K+ transport system membrane component KefB
MSVDSIVTHVAAAAALVIALSYAVGQICRRIRQPEVVAQLFVGIALGPSLLGRFDPGVMHAIFPAKIISYLNVTSQIALVLFLFAVGYELDLRLLRRQGRASAVIAASTFVVPMLLGAGSAYLFGDTLYRAAGESRVTDIAFILFMGVAVSITALPVLAHIVAELGYTRTLPGVTAMASAGMNDVLGWLALAGALIATSASGQGRRPWAITVLLLAVFVAVALFAVRPALKAWLLRPGAVMSDKVPIAVAVAMGSAWVSAALGLHVIFGAFFAGVMMPRQADGSPDADLLRPVLDAGRPLLPLFFIVSGLSVDVGALHGRDLLLFVIVLAIAVVGKAGAGSLAARLTGMDGRQAAAIGVMLNTRGLTELIALNAALQAGIIHQRLYTILVLMALVTTAATGPLLKLEKLRNSMHSVAVTRPTEEVAASMPAVTAKHTEP